VVLVLTESQSQTQLLSFSLPSSHIEIFRSYNRCRLIALQLIHLSLTHQYPFMAASSSSTYVRTLDHYLYLQLTISVN
jgi:hypothetical protein